MRKNVFGKRLKRDTNERKALFKSLMSPLVIHGRITTTLAKAQAIRSQVEKLVTNAKKNKEEAKRHLSPYLSPLAQDKMISIVAPSFANRQGGYTRIIKKGRRITDSAKMVVMEWTEYEQIQNSKFKIQNEGEKILKKKEKVTTEAKKGRKTLKIKEKSSKSKRVRSKKV